MPPRFPAVLALRRTKSTGSAVTISHIHDHAPAIMGSLGGAPRESSSGSGKKLLMNPLDGLSEEELLQRGEKYAMLCQHNHLLHEFQKGALLAQDPLAFQTSRHFNFTEKAALLYEQDHPWSSQCWRLYAMAGFCACTAAVQGVSQSVINGATMFFPKELGIDGVERVNEWILGFIIGAPFFSCALVGCWLTAPLNRLLGRRGTIFFGCSAAFASAIGQAISRSWVALLITRLLLGLSMGPISSTTPMYSAECSPKRIRGALGMLWQVGIGFGIMVGIALDLAFFDVSVEYYGYAGVNWRLMLGSAAIPALLVMAIVFLCPESPCLHLSRGNHKKAFRSMQLLRKTNLQAARDLFLAYSLSLEEQNAQRGNGFFSLFAQLFTVPRNRRAMYAAQITMFMQQFCGLNVIAYYSSVIFREGGLSAHKAVLASLGFGAVNFIFSWPAVLTVDRLGRRALLLYTLPLLAAFALWIGFSFRITSLETRLPVVVAGIYAFVVAYSPGLGSVPFSYSAEAFPLHMREVGMSLTTATNWLFNGILSITWPSLARAFKPEGAFAYYAAWNALGWFLVLLFVPETMGRTLEQLDEVFAVSMTEQALHGLNTIPFVGRLPCIKRRLAGHVTRLKEQQDSHQMILLPSTPSIRNDPHTLV